MLESAVLMTLMSSISIAVARHATTIVVVACDRSTPGSGTDAVTPLSLPSAGDPETSEDIRSA